MTSTANNAAPADEASSSKAFPFSPIFIATITPANIVEGVTKKDLPFATMKGSLVQRPGKNDEVMTVMAFGKSLAAVQAALVEGKPLECAVQFNRGTLKIVGYPHPKAKPAAAAA